LSFKVPPAPEGGIDGGTKMERNGRKVKGSNCAQYVHDSMNYLSPLYNWGWKRSGYARIACRLQVINYLSISKLSKQKRWGNMSCHDPSWQGSYYSGIIAYTNLIEMAQIFTVISLNPQMVNRYKCHSPLFTLFYILFTVLSFWRIKDS